MAEEEEVRKSYDRYDREDLEVVGDLIQQQPYNYLIWNDRRRMVSNIGAGAVSHELEFTNKILLSNPYNIQPWSHREWIIQKFDTNLWLSELRYCHEILDRDIFNVSAWEQICRAVKLYPNMTKELRDVEVAYAKRVIYEHPGNEGPWTYLTFLCIKHLPSLYKNPELECVYVDFLAEEADRIKFVAELDPPPDDWSSNYASLDKRGCLNALSLVAALMVVGYEASLNTRLVEAVDVLLESLDGTYSHQCLFRIKATTDIGSEFSRKVIALALSLDASRIRYRKRCRGYYSLKAFEIIYDTDYEEDDEEPFNINIFDTDNDDEEEEKEDDDEHQNSMRIEMDERFESWLKSNGFGGLPMEWKERLSSTYLKKRTQYNRDENDALEDLKWNARRVMVKIFCSNEVVLNELQFTTDIINDNAYNHRAWSHRQWIFHAFGEDWEDKDELEFCGAIIQKNPYNTFAWDQRYFIITRIVARIYVLQSRPKYNRGLNNKYIDYMDERRREEREFALKFMDANPENHLPWGHISGLYNTYYNLSDDFCENESLVNTILHVLENARDDGKGSVMSLSNEGSASVNNARGVVNAISVLSEFTNDSGLMNAYRKRFKGLVDDLCPYSNNFTDYSLKMCSIVGAMEKASTDCGRFVIHPIDKLLTPSCEGCVYTNF